MLRWVVHLEGGPRRVNHAAVAIGDRKVFTFGGYCTGDDYETIRPIDVHVFDMITYKWTELVCNASNSEFIPYMRYGHTVVAIDDIVYLWGGRNDSVGACNKLFCYDTGQNMWCCPKVIGDIPAARDGHSACVIDNCMYIFGGYEDESECFSNTVHKLDTKTLTWSLLRVSRGESAYWRDFHTAIAIGQYMLVFGGRSDLHGPWHTNHELYCNKVHVFDTKDHSWHQPVTTGQLPDGRRSHSTFLYDGHMYVFGGYNGVKDKHYNDMFKFEPGSMVWTQIESLGFMKPCPRRRQCCCVVGQQMLLFGGTSPCEDPTPGAGDDLNLMDHSDLYILDFAPTLKTLCKLSVITHKLDISSLPHDIRWEITTMTTNTSISRPNASSQG
ncbi:kelch domain-containing protein 3-like [Saccoglossus kowalevskii]|uniref:Kelch domain-containing protein 3-like n=1 Tax=Saccoglossus kowalevskii TaxID=10224 RepID=A0ABM0GJK1_SACKO|nr:PREDICTED: kelch domain-containing protein 3-like [Saccoglossus kowalevskii]